MVVGFSRELRRAFALIDGNPTGCLWRGAATPAAGALTIVARSPDFNAKLLISGAQRADSAGCRNDNSSNNNNNSCLLS